MTHTLTAPDIGDEDIQNEDEKSKQPEPTEIQHRASAIMDISELKSRRKTIREVYENVMIENLHYGKPFKDSSKPSLLKAGGEVLANTFMLSPKYKRTLRDLGAGHREIEFCCQLFHIPTGNFIGEGYGSCSTQESKYRYRKGDTPTDIDIEKDDWDVKERHGNGEFFSHLRKKYERIKGSVPDGMDIGMHKGDGGWVVSVRGKVENPDIANEYNTVLKIAKKRALNDAVLTATGASEYFTQDVEDIMANESATSGGASNGTPADASTPSPDNAQRRGGSGSTQNTSRHRRPAQNQNSKKTVQPTVQQKKLIKENMINLPKERQRDLIQYIKAGKMSPKSAENVIQFLISYDQLYSGIVEFHDTAAKNHVPDVMWDALEGAKTPADLHVISKHVSDMLDAEVLGEDITGEVTQKLHAHLEGQQS